jgi:methylphosphotriester-DNA--protein-cysteine methyltransferase
MSADDPFDFHCAAPTAPLSAFVETIWAVRGTAPYRRSSVLPNGALQLMINFGAPHRVTAFGATAVDRGYRRAWIAGLQDAPLAIESPPQTDLVAIRFRPGGAHAFLPLPLAAVTNDVVEADTVLGAAVDALRDELALAPTRAAQVRAAERWLLGRCRPHERDYAIVARAVAALGSSHDRQPRAPVGLACERLGLSNRHMIQLFRRHVGLAPKAYARVRRFHDALGRLPAATSRAQLALELGYADQAHFNNEFRRFAGVSPGEFVRRRGEDDESLILG